MKKCKNIRRLAMIAGAMVLVSCETGKAAKSTYAVSLRNHSSFVQAAVSTASDEMNRKKASKNKTTKWKKTIIKWNQDWKYAKNSKIHSDSAVLYRSNQSNGKRKVVTINAGHGTKGGSSVKTLCHPDGSPKVTGGSTGAGSVKATAIAVGTTLRNGVSEADANLKFALVLKKVLLENGYDVLMIRETEDAQLDNIARTVYANNNSDCHIAIHYDSTESNKGLFYIGVPNNKKYRSMEPVASNWKKHNALGEAIVSGVKGRGGKIYGSGSMPIDLTQTAYSTVPSVDLEIGDRASNYSDAELLKIAQGIEKGLDQYFK